MFEEKSLHVIICNASDACELENDHVKSEIDLRKVLPSQRGKILNFLASNGFSFFL